MREAWAVASASFSVSIASASRSAVRWSRAWLATSVATAICPRMASTTAPAWAAASAVGPISSSVRRLARRASAVSTRAWATTMAQAKISPIGATAIRARKAMVSGEKAKPGLRAS